MAIPPLEPTTIESYWNELFHAYMQTCHKMDEAGVAKLQKENPSTYQHWIRRYERAHRSFVTEQTNLQSPHGIVSMIAASGQTMMRRLILGNKIRLFSPLPIANGSLPSVRTQALWRGSFQRYLSFYPDHCDDHDPPSFGQRLMPQKNFQVIRGGKIEPSFEFSLPSWQWAPVALFTVALGALCLCSRLRFAGSVL